MHTINFGSARRVKIPGPRLEGRFTSLLRGTLALALAAGLAACTSVPFDYPREAGYAAPPDAATRLGAASLDWQARHEEQAGVVRLPYGIDALGLRLRTMEVAERTIDAQYFILKNDDAGALFVGKLLLAADRGVKVRLLIDDIFSTGIDRQLTLLDTHPNIEVRLFNPLSRRGLKYLNYLLDFSRANRRMHNKSFTVDSSLSIVGGRNIGEEYFELKQDVLFDDYEVLVIGPVVQDISDGFDAFWNSELSVPVAAFDVTVDTAELNRWRQVMRQKTDEGATGIYARALNSRVLRDLESGLLQPALADSTLVVDPPEKLQHSVDERDLAVLAQELRKRFDAAQLEVLIVTPYFIPQERGMAVLTELLGRGVRLVIVTNSLASTNHIPVHSGYARYRKQLLEAGAEIWEIRARNPRGKNDWGYRPEFVTLHSKATAIDRRTMAVGSVNFDPRSIRLNSEMALFLDSWELGNVFAANLFMELPQVAYRVELDDNDKLRWTYAYRGETEVLSREPQAGFGRRLAASLYALLPIEDQL